MDLSSICRMMRNLRHSPLTKCRVTARGNPNQKQPKMDASKAPDHPWGMFTWLLSLLAFGFSANFFRRSVSSLPLCPAPHYKLRNVFFLCSLFLFFCFFVRDFRSLTHRVEDFHFFFCEHSLFCKIRIRSSFPACPQQGVQRTPHSLTKACCS